MDEITKIVDVGCDNKDTVFVVQSKKSDEQWEITFKTYQGSQKDGRWFTKKSFEDALIAHAKKDQMRTKNHKKRLAAAIETLPKCADTDDEEEIEGEASSASKPKKLQVLPGALKRDDKDNNHYQSLDLVPYKLSALFDMGKVQVDYTEATDRDTEDMDHFRSTVGEARAGRVTVNQLQVPESVKLVKTKLKSDALYGTPEKLFKDSKLIDSDLQDYCRILALYFSDTLPPKMQQKHMTDGYTPWKAVFVKDTKSDFWKKIVLKSALSPRFVLNQVEPMQRMKQLLNVETDAQLRTKLPKTKMTVYEFIVSPWSYGFLPLHRLESVFSLGEVLSPVCKRCARPFADYPINWFAMPLNYQSTVKKGKENADVMKLLQPAHTDKTQCPLPHAANVAQNEWGIPAQAGGLRKSNKRATNSNLFRAVTSVFEDEQENEQPLLWFLPEPQSKKDYNQNVPQAERGRYFLPARNTASPKWQGPCWDFKQIIDSKMPQASNPHFACSGWHLQRHGAPERTSSNVCLDCIKYLEDTGLVETRPNMYTEKNPNVDVPDPGEIQLDTSVDETRFDAQLRTLRELCSKTSYELYQQAPAAVRDKFVQSAGSNKVVFKKRSASSSQRYTKTHLVKALLPQTQLHADIAFDPDKINCQAKIQQLLRDKRKEQMSLYSPQFWTDFATKVINEQKFKAEYRKWLKENVKSHCVGMVRNESKVASKTVKVGQIYKRVINRNQTDLSRERAAFDELASQIDAVQQGQAIEGEMNVYLRDALDQIEHETLLREKRKLVGSEVALDFDSEAWRIEHRFKDYMRIEYNNGELSGKFHGVKDGMLWDRFENARNAAKLDHRVIDYDSKPSSFAVKQWRKMKQSKFFVTYVLHRPAVDDGSKGHNEHVALQFARAVRRMTLDENLCTMVRFGYMLKDGKRALIEAKKQDAEDYKHSYTADTWASHMHYVTVDCGVEIAPQTRNFHFHMVLSFTHWSKLQLDTMQMGAWLERSFKGLHADENDNFFITDVNGQQWYSDADNPYIDLKLLAQDDFNEVIARYIRKTHTATVAQRDATRGGALNIRRQPEDPRTFVDRVTNNLTASQARAQSAGVDDLNRDN